MPLFPLDPPPSLYPLFWGWLSLCVKLYRGVITAPLEEGGLLEQEAGRCSCLNWPTSTESEQPRNYATAPNPFPWKKKKKKNTASTGSLHLFTQGEKEGSSKIYPWVTSLDMFYSHTFCPLTMLKLYCSPFMWSTIIFIRAKHYGACGVKQNKKRAVMKSRLSASLCIKTL